MLIKKLFIIFCFNLLIAFNVFSQNKIEKIRGVIYDSSSKSRIANVMIYPSVPGDTIYSDAFGRFNIQISSDFLDDIHFEHPGYYQYLLRIKKASNHYLQTIFLIDKAVELDTIFYPSFPENKRTEGRILDQQTMLPVNEAVLETRDNKRIGYTNGRGIYILYIPEPTSNLIVTHPDYFSSIIDLKQSTHGRTKDYLLMPIQQSAGIDSWMQDKNSVRLIVNELLHGAVALDYERFLNKKHSFGIKSSVHFFKGIPMPVFPSFETQNLSDFYGIKLSPYYRFYQSRTLKRGFFYEAKISWGYYDFDGIYYHVDRNSEYGSYFPEISNTLGFGASFGWMIRFSPGPVLLNISAGAQYFPLNVPKTEHGYIYNDYVELKLDDSLWHYGGPGSYLEIKFMIGGIF